MDSGRRLENRLPLVANRMRDRGGLTIGPMDGDTHDLIGPQSKMDRGGGLGTVSVSRQNPPCLLSGGILQNHPGADRASPSGVESEADPVAHGRQLVVEDQHSALADGPGFLGQHDDIQSSVPSTSSATRFLQSAGKVRPVSQPTSVHSSGADSIIRELCCQPP